MMRTDIEIEKGRVDQKKEESLLLPLRWRDRKEGDGKCDGSVAGGLRRTGRR